MRFPIQHVYLEQHVYWFCWNYPSNTFIRTTLLLGTLEYAPNIVFIESFLERNFAILYGEMTKVVGNARNKILMYVFEWVAPAMLQIWSRLFLQVHYSPTYVRCFQKMSSIMSTVLKKRHFQVKENKYEHWTQGGGRVF